jgi:hypothetical protein
MNSVFKSMQLCIQRGFLRPWLARPVANEALGLEVAE